jgi:glucose/arabinose dehydrogenase
MITRRRIAFLVIGLFLGASVAGVAWLRHTNYWAVWDRLTGTDEPDEGPAPPIDLVPAFPELEFALPLYLTHAGDGRDEVYVVEQGGRIWRFENRPDVTERTLWLDLTERIPRRRHNEEGLLALEFHPRFSDNGYIYVHYSQHRDGDKPRRGVTSRFTVSGEDRLPDIDSELILQEFPQPYGNHNGCALKFGPDGYLYVSMGDGGAAGDPHDHGQNLETLLGTILRIDVDKKDEGLNYAIPEDNPFVGRDDAKPEIWAWGLRNVWRMSFDREHGTLWAADVGQVTREEVNIITRGGNYGWARREGFVAHEGGEKTDDMIDPVIDYGRQDGISITGGYVYRGQRHDELQGVYIYGDYGTGRIWGLRYDLEADELKSNQLLWHDRLSISSFGEDRDGELYVCGHREGRIYRIQPRE